MEGLPERFRALRKQRNLTSSALARPKYSVSYVSQIERGERRPSREAAEYFARRLGVSPSFLTTGVPDDLPIRLRLTLEEAEAAYAEGSFEDARAKAAAVRDEAETYDLRPVRQWAAAILADALYRLARHTEAASTYEQLLAERDLSRSLRVRATAGLGRVSRAAGDLIYAAEVVESYLGAEHDPPLDHAALADLHTVLVSVYFERDDLARAQRAAERALEAMDESVPIRTQAIARHHAARVLVERGELEEALRLEHEARTLMGTLQNKRDMGKLYTAYAFLCLEVTPPRIEEAERHLNRSERLLRQVGGGPDLAYVHTERARAAFLAERFEEAVEHAERTIATEAVFVLEKARALLLRGRALRALGRLPGAKDAIRDALAIFEDNGASQQAVLCWRELGQIADQEGDKDAAVRAYRTGVELSGGGRASLIF